MPAKMTIKQIVEMHKARGVKLVCSGIMGGGKHCVHCKKHTSSTRFSLGRWGRYVWCCDECGEY